MLYDFASTGPKAKTADGLYQQLMKNNATWTIIDRGETSSYLPIWELMGKFTLYLNMERFLNFSFLRSQL
jgi:hypothetical protein